ncbi:hypothetical protein NOR_08598 [Metarhizium rileyi]|uniref:Uncharacterized protein n=1 Tax=Metarhizium rileyi (strain RCEF 4871) TaxID=1649241 RepID=A0A166VZL7_METRR|nr:hypothetical protein NOR_08598 [Metarhizium rileyi RCEF 4871]
MAKRSPFCKPMLGWMQEVPHSSGNALSQMSRQKQSNGTPHPRSDDPTNWTRRICIDQRLSPQHSPLLKLLPLAPNNDFTDQLRKRLRLIEFQQGIRRDLYGEAVAREYPIGHTPDAIREEARASHSIYDSSSEPSSPRSFDDEHRCEATQKAAHDTMARHFGEHPTQFSLLETVGKQYRIWPSPPSLSCPDSPPIALTGKISRVPKRKRSEDDGTATAVSRRSRRLRGENPIELLP